MLIKHKPLYRIILRDAWRITWTQKSLWVFGFLAAFLQTANVIELFARAFSRVSDHGATISTFLANAYPGAALAGVLGVIKIGTTHIAGIGVIMLALLLAFCALLLWIFATAQAGLVAAASGKIPSRLNLPALFKKGHAFSVPIIGLHIFSRLLLAALFIAVTLPLFLVARTTDTATIGIAFGAFVVFVPIALILSFMTIFAVAGIVINRQPFFQSINAAWHLTKNHFLISIETACILFAINIAGGILVVLFALLLAFPVYILTLGALVAGVGSVGVALAVISLILVFGLVLLLGAVISTFQITTWVLLYRRFAKPGAVAKLVRLAHVIPRYLKTVR